jgi:DNA-binding CsgD family transcriptional regulator
VHRAWVCAVAARQAGDAPGAVAHLAAIGMPTDNSDDIEVDLRLRAHCELAFSLALIGRTNDAVEASHRAVSIATRCAPAARSEALAVQVVTAAMAGRPWDRAELAEALKLEDPLRRSEPPFRATAVAAMIAIFDDELDDAVKFLEQLIDQGMATGPLGDVSWVSVFLGLAHHRRGRLGPWEGGDAARVATWFSDFVAVSRRVFVGGDDTLPPLGVALQKFSHTPTAMTVGLISFAGIYLARGQIAEVVDLAGALEPLMATSGVAEPIICSWLVDLAEGRALLGDATGASVLLEQLAERQRERPRRSVAAALARVSAVVSEQRNDLNDALRWAGEGVAGFCALGWPIEEGRARLVLARIHWRLRARKQALIEAKTAAELFASAHSGAWLSVASGDVERYTVMRGAAVAERTLAEARVETMAIEGMSVTAMAAALNLSPKTIESHLTAIYRKSGVRNRRELQALTRA